MKDKEKKTQAKSCRTIVLPWNSYILKTISALKALYEKILQDTASHLIRRKGIFL